MRFNKIDWISLEAQWRVELGHHSLEFGAQALQGAVQRYCAMKLPDLRSATGMGHFPDNAGWHRRGCTELVKLG